MLLNGALLLTVLSAQWSEWRQVESCVDKWILVKMRSNFKVLSLLMLCFGCSHAWLWSWSRTTTLAPASEPEGSGSLGAGSGEQLENLGKAGVEATEDGIQSRARIWGATTETPQLTTPLAPLIERVTAGIPANAVQPGNDTSLRGFEGSVLANFSGNASELGLEGSGDIGSTLWPGSGSENGDDNSWGSGFERLDFAKPKSIDSSDHEIQLNIHNLSEGHHLNKAEKNVDTVNATSRANKSRSFKMNLRTLQNSTSGDLAAISENSSPENSLAFSNTGALGGGRWYSSAESNKRADSSTNNQVSQVSRDHNTSQTDMLVTEKSVLVSQDTKHNGHVLDQNVEEANATPSANEGSAIDLLSPTIGDNYSPESILALNQPETSTADPQRTSDPITASKKVDREFSTDNQVDLNSTKNDSISATDKSVLLSQDRSDDRQLKKQNVEFTNTTLRAKEGSTVDLQHLTIGTIVETSTANPPRANWRPDLDNQVRLTSESMHLVTEKSALIVHALERNVELANATPGPTTGNSVDNYSPENIIALNNTDAFDPLETSTADPQTASRLTDSTTVFLATEKQVRQRSEDQESSKTDSIVLATERATKKSNKNKLFIR